jgi:hypothetical protein
MSRRPLFIERVYARALLLYPSQFSRAYSEPMRQSLHDAITDLRNDPHRALLPFCCFIVVDLVTSAIKERLSVMPATLGRRPILFHALTVAFVITLLGGFAMIFSQQLLRRGADQPQTQMVNDAAALLSGGARPEDVIPSARIDVQHSLEPFLFFYDAQGKPQAGSGTLQNAIPSPPPGVFEFVRAHGSEKLTWQPRPDVRIASVVRRVEGPHPGFILAGRSLREVEQQEINLYRLSLALWFVLMCVLAAAAWLLARVQKTPTPPSGQPA